MNALHSSQSFGYYSVRHRRIEFVISGGVMARKEKTSSVEVLSFIAIYVRFFLASVFAAATFDMIDSLSVSVWGSGVIFR